MYMVRVNRSTGRPRLLAAALMVGAAIGGSGIRSPAAAQLRQESVQDYDIPAGSLTAALIRLVEQSGLQLTYEAALTEGLTTGELRGRYTPKEALSRLLSGTGLAARATGAASVTIVRATSGTLELDPARVRGAVVDDTQAGNRDLDRIRQRDGADTIIVTAQRSVAGGQVADGGRLGLLGNANVFETPFSTTSFTNKLILDQGARSIDDIVLNDPSIRTSLSSTFVIDQTSIRGFLSNTYLFDGLQGFTSYGRSAIQNFERVEIFKGPTAGLIGAVGAVGGVINLLPKRAVDKPVLAATLGVRDESLFSGQLDVGQRLGSSGKFGVRLNVYAERGDEFNGSGRRLFVPQLAVDFRGERVRFVIDANYTHYKMIAPGINFVLQPGVAVPKAPDGGINPSPDWWRFENEQYFVLGTGEWDFVDNWTAYARYGYFREEKPFTREPGFSRLASDGSFSINGAGYTAFAGRNRTGEAGVRGKVSLGWSTHRLALSALRVKGYDGIYEGYDVDYTPVAQSIYRTSTAPTPGSVLLNDDYAFPINNVVTSSVAIADDVSLFDDRLKLIIAARRVRIKGDGYDKSRTTPTFAALYKLPGGFSIYGNYAEALNQGDTAPDEATNARQQLPPYVGRQREAGVKWNAGRYGVTLAYFDIDQASAILDTDNVFRAAGRQRNRGVEVETFGEPMPGLRMLGGAAWIDGKQEKTQNGLFDGNKALGVPTWTVNLNAEYDPSILPGLTLTARALYTAGAYVDQGNTQRLPSWERFDLGARYAARFGETPLTFRVGVNNLFDKAYWQAGGRNILTSAAPRTWQASVTAGF